jgi:hypothetical protein
MSSTASPLETRRARVRAIRARVAAGAVAVFVAVFGFLFGQLSSGSDPGLTDSASASAGTTTTSAAQDDDSSSSSDQTWSTNTPSSVQTGQS